MNLICHGEAPRMTGLGLHDARRAGERMRQRLLAKHVFSCIKRCDYQLLVGGRYDHSDFKDDATGTARTDSRFSPLVGAVWAPRPELSVLVTLLCGA